MVIQWFYHGIISMFKNKKQGKHGLSPWLQRENHGNTMVLPWYHSKSINQKFSFHNNIYTVFLPLATNKMILNKTLLNICNFLIKLC